VAVIAMVAVVAVAVTAHEIASGTGGSGAASAIRGIYGSQSLATLEAERQQLIAINAAANTLTVVAEPKLARAGAVASANPNSSTNIGSITYIPSSPPDPKTAEATAYNLMASFGFPPATFYGCLFNLWQRESNWRYDAENASGAYGIPQALPGSKMASAGPDWQTNPATQIAWGLGYIKGKYGNPCAAWANEEAYGYY
jgi:hypothetical protein